MSWSESVLVACVVLAGVGCAAPLDVESAESDVIHGQDDRREWYEVESESLRDRTARSAVAIIKRDRMDDSDPDDIRFLGPNLGEAESLCDDQPYIDQPTAAHCGGTLIGDDLVLTAGHCIDALSPCSELVFVFGYYYQAPGTLHRVTADDVFECAEVVAQVDGLTTDGNLDHAIVRLDRPATPQFEPATVEMTAPVAAEQALAVVSFGMGIPAKIDTGSHVVDPRAEQQDYFELDSDTFVHSSGGGVFDADGSRLLGIFVRGQRDLVESAEGCMVANQCLEGGCDGKYESASYAHHALRHLCDEAPDTSLCQL